MEVWNVLTYRDYDFIDPKSGRQFKGRTLYCYRENFNGWPGVEFGKFSVPANSPAFLQIPELGVAYEVIFDRFGKVSVLNKVN